MAKVRLGCVQIHFCYFNGGKMVDAPGAWFKGVVHSLLINHGCVFSVTCNKPIRVSFPILFKSQVHLQHGGLLLWLRICQKGHFSAEETELFMHKVKRTIHNEHTGPCCSWTLPWSATDHQFKILFINLLQMYFRLFFEKIFFLLQLWFL